jgi:hypothetical protein
LTGFYHQYAVKRSPPERNDLSTGNRYFWRVSVNTPNNAARERLDQIQLENEIKKLSFDLREKEMDTQARERERALADSRTEIPRMEPLIEALRLIKRQTELESAMRRPGGIRITEERELHQPRGALSQYPAAVTAILEAASRMRRPVDTISAEDVEPLTISTSH